MKISEDLVITSLFFFFKQFNFLSFVKVSKYVKYIGQSDRQTFAAPSFVQDPDSLVQDTHCVEGQRQGAMPDVHMTVERILTVGRVLHYLEKVDINGKGLMQLP